MRALFAAILGLFAIILPCTTRGAELNLAPLVYYHSTETEQEFRLLGPVYEKTTSHQALRPFYYHDEERSEYLYPLGSSNEGRSHFLPLYRRDTNRTDPRGEVFPCFWGTYEGQRYGGVFPLYGTLIHRLGKDEAGFVLWPLYSWSKTGEKKTTSILWPIFTYSKDREFKIFPLYGQETDITGSYHYILWPIFHHKHMYDPKMDAVLPLYLSMQGDKSRSTSILWPFFTYNNDEATGHTSLDAPWPFVRFAHGGYEESRVLPFYWKKTQPNGYSRRAIIWPLYITETDTDLAQGVQEEKTRFLLIGSYKEVRTNDSTAQRFYILPLWYSYQDNTVSRWQFPYILPITDAGYRRNWEPLFTLAHGEKNENAAEFDILWHMIYYTRNNANTRLMFSFLGSYESGADYRQIGMLSDLLKFRWKIKPPNIEPEAAASTSDTAHP